MVGSSQTQKGVWFKVGTKYLRIYAMMNEKDQHGIILHCPAYGDANSDNAKIEVSWYELFFHPDAIFLQSLVPWKIDLQNSFSKIRNYGERVTLFHRLLQECNGDHFMLAELRKTWLVFLGGVHGY